MERERINGHSAKRYDFNINIMERKRPSQKTCTEHRLFCHNSTLRINTTPRKCTHSLDLPLKAKNAEGIPQKKIESKITK